MDRDDWGEAGEGRKDKREKVTYNSDSEFFIPVQFRPLIDWIVGRT